MSAPSPDPPENRPSTALILLAFGAVYLAYGFNYFAVREGVKTLPPLLFAGAHITLAGLVLFGYLIVSRQSFRMNRATLLWAAIGGCVIFVGGTGMLALAERPGPEGVDSGVAAVLRATTPLWVIVLEWLRPRGERFGMRTYLGLAIAVGGVVLLLSHRLTPENFLKDTGVLLVFLSALAWALGTLIIRYHRHGGPSIVATAHQMLLGGFAMLVTGVLLGEVEQFNKQELTSQALLAFVYLLIFHSLVAFVAINWLLGHVSAALVTTYDYVTPIMAVLAGWFFLDEPLGFNSIAGMALILAGVALALSTSGQHR
ncbi:MAG: EamA family transporter [Gemmataceae bacterium]|nr:EamA family transporter [Gemmataceae bacterium]